MITRIVNLSRIAAAALNRLQPALLLLIRLFWGWQFAITGYGKLQHLPRVAAFFASLHLPAPMATAAFVACVELFGGILLAIGALSRLNALVLFVDMTVAYWTADRQAFLSLLSAPDKFYGADPFLFWAVALLILIFGSGAYSIDRLIMSRLKPENPSVADTSPKRNPLPVSEERAVVVETNISRPGQR